jgi:hypothetical protein
MANTVSDATESESDSGDHHHHHHHHRHPSWDEEEVPSWNPENAMRRINTGELYAMFDRDGDN